MGAPMPPSESSWQVWYCQVCRKAARAIPEMPVACECDRPVLPLRPTLVTQVHAPKSRPLQALTEEEGRLRALARRGTRVRVTFEAEVVDAQLWGTAGGPKKLQLFVRTPDGERHPIDPGQAGVHIEALDDGGA